MAFHPHIWQVRMAQDIRDPFPPSSASASPARGWQFWLGWVLTLLPALMLLSGSITAWLALPKVVEGIAQAGWPVDVLRVIGTLEFVCAVLFIIPRTAVFGALLMTAYLGGATASHVRLHQGQWVVPVVFGVIVWAAMLLREPRLRAVLPLRKF
jgi:hypothetical protein